VKARSGDVGRLRISARSGAPTAMPARIG